MMQWIGYLIDKKLEIPLAGSLNDIEAAPGEFVHLIRANFKDEL
ncbi:hypothetical protein [Acetatifactor aquisgranensis]|nr:hypothetical protein [Acetatifactor aquisgranensis]